MTPDEIENAAERLDLAEKNRTQIGLLSLAHPEITMGEAYAIQSAWMKRKFASGRKAIGWKIGLTSKAMQSALNIDIPDSGLLLDDMLFDDGAIIPPGRFIQPRIEAEIAFIMRAPLRGPDVKIIDVMKATEYVTPALEILDTRILRADPVTGQMRKFTDTIADNAANAGLILGSRMIRPDDVDMRWMGAILSRNAQVEETGLGAGVLNHPARGIVWLANRLADYGRTIEAGQIILTGSFVRPVEARAGDTIVGDFGAYGNIGCHFA